MRKSIGLISLVVFVLVTLFAGSAYADLNIKWFQVQKRTYENGNQFARVQFAVNDYNLVVDVRLYRNDLQISGVDIDSFTFVKDISYYVPYDASNSIWNWSSVVPGEWNVDEMYYMNYSLSLLVDGADYTIEVDWDDGSISGTKAYTIHFSQVIDLPIVSPAASPYNKNKDPELKVESLDDGSMVVRWKAPTVNYGGTRQVVYLSIGPKIVYIHQPTHMGMLIVPSDVIAVLKTDPDYQGNFYFLVQLRTIDNCNRTYSDWCQFEF